MNIFTLAAIFLTAVTTAFSQGHFLDYKLTVNDIDQGNISFYSQNGNCRSEMNVTGTSFSEFRVVNILPANNQKFIFQIDEGTRRYTKIDITSDPDWKDYSKEDYQITVIGSEMVNGYNTTHVRITSKGQPKVIELWTTSEIASYEELIKMRTVFSGKPNLYKALREANAYGFPARIRTTEMTTTEEDEVIQADLQKSESRDIAPSLFNTEGYTLFATVKNKKPTDVFLMMMGYDPDNLPKE